MEGVKLTALTPPLPMKGVKLTALTPPPANGGGQTDSPDPLPMEGPPGGGYIMYCDLKLKGSKVSLLSAMDGSRLIVEAVLFTLPREGERVLFNTITVEEPATADEFLFSRSTLVV
ncbi:hypothetical protein ACOMHN_028545 [Nucella lapillus]